MSAQGQCCPFLSHHNAGDEPGESPSAPYSTSQVMHLGGYRWRWEPAGTVRLGTAGQWLVGLMRVCSCVEPWQGWPGSSVCLVTNLTPTSKVWETFRGRNLKDKCNFLCHTCFETSVL